MLFLDKNVDSESRLLIWQMDEPVEDIATKAGVAGDDDYLKLKAKRRGEWAFTRYALKTVFPTAKIAYHDTGRPYLAGQRESISISHSGKFASLLLNQSGKRLGLDIEKRDSAKVLRVLAKFLSPAEMQIKPTEDELVNALLFWTAKEAVFKLTDLRHVDFIEDYEIMPFRLGNDLKGEGLIMEKRTGGCCKMHYEVFPGFVMSWVVAPSVSVAELNSHM